jgi:hypothetical protein
VKLRIKALSLTCVLFGLADPLALRAQFFLTVDNGSGSLKKIDQQTLAITNIGSLGVTFSFGDLAWNPNTSTLYMIDGRGAQGLYTVNVTTGAATLVGTHGITDLFGLAYNTQNNTLYATGFNNTTLYSLNPTTGAATAIGSTGVRIGALAFNSQLNVLVGVNDGTGDIYQLNLTTGASTLLAQPGYTNNSGATYDSVLNRLFDIGVDGYLYSYDIANGYTRSTLLSSAGTFDGLAYIGAIPEPASAALVVSSLVLVGGLARSRSSRRFGSAKVPRAE